MTRIDSPHCTGQILAANAYGQYHTTYCVGVDGECQSKLDGSPTTPDAIAEMVAYNTWFSREVKKKYDNVVDAMHRAVFGEAAKQSPPPPIDWAKTFKGGMSAGGSVHQTSSPHPLDPPEPSEDELRTFCNTIYQRMMTFRYSSAVDLLRGQLAEAREHGRQEVARRLPRLWGKWDGKGWLSSEHGPALAWSEVAVAMSVLPDWEVREYDPLTGGPKG